MFRLLTSTCLACSLMIAVPAYAARNQDLPSIEINLQALDALKRRVAAESMPETPRYYGEVPSQIESQPPVAKKSKPKHTTPPRDWAKNFHKVPVAKPEVPYDVASTEPLAPAPENPVPQEAQTHVAVLPDRLPTSPEKPAEKLPSEPVMPERLPVTNAPKNEPKADDLAIPETLPEPAKPAEPVIAQEEKPMEKSADWSTLVKDEPKEEAIPVELPAAPAKPSEKVEQKAAEPAPVEIVHAPVEEKPAIVETKPVVEEKPVEKPIVEEKPAEKPVEKPVEVASLPQTPAAPPPSAEPLTAPVGALAQAMVKFGAGESEIKAEANAQLNGVLESLKKDPKSRLNIVGYAAESQGGTASLGTGEARRVSLRRALSARKFFVDNGIDSARMNVRAMGDKVDSGDKDRVDVFVVN